MVAGISFFLIIVAVLALTVVVFGFWVVVVIARALGRLVGIVPPKRLSNRMPTRLPGNVLTKPAPKMVQRCARPNCRHDNPIEARFCTRCGADLRAGAAQKVWTAA